MRSHHGHFTRGDQPNSYLQRLLTTLTLPINDEMCVLKVTRYNENSHEIEYIENKLECWLVGWMAGCRSLSLIPFK